MRASRGALLSALRASTSPEAKGGVSSALRGLVASELARAQAQQAADAAPMDAADELWVRRGTAHAPPPAVASLVSWQEWDGGQSTPLPRAVRVNRFARRLFVLRLRKADDDACLSDAESAALLRSLEDSLAEEMREEGASVAR